MFTVMIRYAKTRREVLIPARSVEFIYHGDGAAEPGLLINHGVDAEGGCHLGTSTSEEDARDVFVMNANGKTVARYNL